MPILYDDETVGQPAANGLFELDCSEYAQLISHLETHSTDCRREAEHLCESARSLLYQYPRLTFSQAQQLAELFTKAVHAIRSDANQYRNSSEQDAALNYALHIDRRINSLKDLRKDHDSLTNSWRQTGASSSGTPPGAGSA